MFARTLLLIRLVLATSEVEYQGACSSHPCGFGTCEEKWNDELRSFVCKCSPGYEGTLCFQDVDECESGPCENGGTCRDGVNAYLCECKLGYTGDNCEAESDRCESNPCMNGATCHSMPNGYVCSCAPGYKGNHCETDINECASQPCQNSGACVDRVNQFSCVCPPGVLGLLCDTQACSPDPCERGTCTVGETGETTCVCPVGWFGKRCELSSCINHDCLYGGTCTVEAESSRYSCMCPTGYYGRKCQIMGPDVVPENTTTTRFSLAVDAMYQQQFTNLTSLDAMIFLKYFVQETIIDRLEEILTGENFTVFSFKVTELRQGSVVVEFALVTGSGFKGAQSHRKALMSSLAGAANQLDDRHVIRESYTHHATNQDVSACVERPCKNGGGCINDGDTYFCLCENGYQGQNCEMLMGAKANPAYDAAYTDNDPDDSADEDSTDTEDKKPAAGAQGDEEGGLMTSTIVGLVGLVALVCCVVVGAVVLKKVQKKKSAGGGNNVEPMDIDYVGGTYRVRDEEDTEEGENEPWVEHRDVYSE